MAIVGHYYLHQNGSLIYKPNYEGDTADFRESDLVRGFWLIDPEDREGCWSLLIESLCAGADKSKVTELAELWKCNNEDSIFYANRIGLDLDIDGSMFCAKRMDFVSIQESQVGFGETALEAMSELCKNLGYRTRKTWGPTFKDLVKVQDSPCI